MEKNIAAFLDDSAYSVSVRFGGVGHNYTYVTNVKGIEVGDAVVVPVIGTVRAKLSKFESINGENEGVDRYDAKVATVTEVHPDVNIPTDSDLEFKWLIAKVDFDPWLATMERNNKIVAAVDDAYKRNLRRSFSERILGEMLEGPKQELLALLGKQKRKPLSYEDWLATNDYTDSSRSLLAYQDYVKDYNA